MLLYGMSKGCPFNIYYNTAYEYINQQIYPFIFNVFCKKIAYCNVLTRWILMYSYTQVFKMFRFFIKNSLTTLFILIKSALSWSKFID